MNCNIAQRLLMELRSLIRDKDADVWQRDCASVMAGVIRMYANCSCMLDARGLFDSMQKPDVLSWNALLLGYVANGEGRTALNLFSAMKAADGCVPDSITFIAAIKACASIGDLQRGRQVHSEAAHLLHDYVLSTLIAMYARCGSMGDARKVFDSIRTPGVVAWNALLLGYAQNGEERTALELFSRMKTKHGCVPNSVTCIAALKACSSLSVKGDRSYALQRGREIHFANARSCLTAYVQNTLIDMYSKCGSMKEARRVFEALPKPVLVSWNALLLGYAQNGEGETALELFSRMKLRPDSLTYVAAVKACTDLAMSGSREIALKRGREIHSEIGCYLNLYVANTLIDMYAKCGSMVEAQRVFDAAQKLDVVTWNALLLGYTENGEGAVALKRFSEMKANQRCCSPDSVTYVAVIKACTSLAASGACRSYILDWGRKLHAEAAPCMDVYVASALIDMYSKLGSMVEARRVFDKLDKVNAVCWSALLLGYADHGEGQTVLDLFARMKNTPGALPAPDAVTYIAVLKACVLTGALALGRRIHSDIAEYTPHLVACLVDFYAKCGSLLEACEAFDLHPRLRELATWTALLAGYGRLGDSGFVLNLFEALESAGFRPDAVTLLCMLVWCSYAGLVGNALELFRVMPVRYAVAPEVCHYNSLVDALSRANLLNEASEVIRAMPCSPNAATWMTLLGACCKWKNVEIGEWAFSALVKIEDKNAAAYVLMAHIYGSSSMWEEQERVLAMRKKIEPSSELSG